METCDKRIQKLVVKKHGKHLYEIYLEQCTCNRKPYAEVYYQSHTCGELNENCPYDCTMHWSYLCFFHFVIDRVTNLLFRSGRGYVYVSDEKTWIGRLRDKYSSINM